MEQQKLVFSEKPHKEDKAHQKEKKILFLKDIVSIVTSKVSVDEVDIQNYISTENMIPNLGGIFESDSKPLKGNITAFKKNDILISNIRPYLKKIWYSDKDGGCSSDVLVLRTINEKIDQKYLFYILSSDKFFNYVMSTSKGTKMPRGDKKAILKFKVPITYIENQKQYSNFLTIIDKKIELLEKKYENKKLIKNYYLNKILTEDFEKNKEWDFKPLNEITFYQEGPGVRNYQYVHEGVKLLNVGNFVENQLILENTDRYISEEEAYGMYNHFLVDEGDLLIACSGIRAEYFDEKIAFAEKEHLPLCMNTSTMRFKSLDDNYLNLNYLKWYFQTKLFKKQIFRVLTGSAQFNFGPTHLKYLRIIVPSMDYQIKISNFFDLIKEDLDCTKRQIEEMKKFKKGLLQKMFV